MRNLATTSALLLLTGCGGCNKDEEGAPVVYDDPSSLTIDSPSEGEWMSEGAVSVTGLTGNIESVSVNGQPAILDASGSFSSTVTLERGVNVIDVQGIEPDGDIISERRSVMAGKYADPGSAVEDGIQMRLNQGGINEMADMVEGMVTAETLNKALGPELNPVFQYGDPEDWNWAAADLESIDFSAAEITAIPNDLIELEVVLPNLNVDIFAYGEAVTFDFTQDIVMTADNAVITASLALGAEDGTLTVELIDPVVELQGFAYDTTLLPSFVEDYFFIETIQTAIQDTLIEQMQAMVPALLDEQLGALDFSFDTELMGTTVAVDASFADVDVDDDGVAIAIDVDVDVPTVGTQIYQGYMASGEGTPNIDRGADLAMVLSDELLNRMLFEVWRGGMLNLTLSTDDGSLEPAMLSLLHAEQGTVTVTADLPPVIVESEGGLQVQVGELSITLETPGGELGERVVIDVAAFVDLELSLDGSTIALDLGKPELIMAVRESDWGSSNEALTALIEEMLPIDLLLLALGALEFELPAFEGLAFGDTEVERSNSGYHTDVEIQLVVE
ncbi:MAG: hypothetical protein ACI8RZ_001103 [Myxococcota bacterium]|jgi:hypothetical protein